MSYRLKVEIEDKISFRLFLVILGHFTNFDSLAIDNLYANYLYSPEQFASFGYRSE